jgi:hypothetical protein
LVACCWRVSSRLRPTPTFLVRHHRHQSRAQSVLPDPGKSRWATDYDGGFPIRDFGCDFVVLAVLNRGCRNRKRASGDGVRPPEFYVLPVEVVRAAEDPRSKWGKVYLRNMKDPDRYLEDWRAVKEFLRPWHCVPAS